MIPVIILAAGTSSRLGQPKQLLPYNGKPLLLHTTDEALAAGSGPVVVVLGAHADVIRQVLEGRLADVVHHPGWAAGMGSTIKAGLRAVLAQWPGASGILLMLCDQPFADRALLRRILAHHASTGNGIIAAAYAGTWGAPVFFSSVYFDDLMGLTDNAGAKGLLDRHRADVASVPFPGGHLDVDTAQDVEWLGMS